MTSNSSLSEYKAIAYLTDEDRGIGIATTSAPTAGVTDDDLESLAEAINRSDWPEWRKVMDEELVFMANCDV